MRAHYKFSEIYLRFTHTSFRKHEKRENLSIIYILNSECLKIEPPQTQLILTLGRGPQLGTCSAMVVVSLI
jgi:hypothetical protein